jgi:hypothetical protein
MINNNEPNGQACATPPTKEIRLLGKPEKCERRSEYFTAIICEKIICFIKLLF